MWVKGRAGRAIGDFPCSSIHFYNGPAHFLSHLPEVNELHMLPRARLAAPRASCSASQLTIGQTLLSDFIRSLLQGVLAFDSAKKKKKKGKSQRRLPAKSCTLTWSCYEHGSTEADFGCRMREQIQNISDADESSPKVPCFAVFGGFMWEAVFMTPLKRSGLSGLETVGWLMRGSVLIWVVTAAHVAPWFSWWIVWERVFGLQHRENDAQ